LLPFQGRFLAIQRYPENVWWQANSRADDTPMSHSGNPYPERIVFAFCTVVGYTWELSPQPFGAPRESSFRSALQRPDSTHIQAQAPSLQDSGCLQEIKFHAQAYLSAKPPPPRQDPRLSLPHEVQSRCRRTEPPPRQGTAQDRGLGRIPRLALSSSFSTGKPTRDAWVLLLMEAI
jgi:hypothetical protein